MDIIVNMIKKVKIHNQVRIFFFVVLESLVTNSAQNCLILNNFNLTQSLTQILRKEEDINI